MFPFKSFVCRPTIVAAAIWFAAIGVGFWLMVDYQTTPGPAIAASLRWPSASRLTRDPHRANLMMFVHPHCSCTKASLEELAKIMTAARGLVAAQMVMVVPPGAGEGWDKTELRETASEIPDVRVVVDENGRERAIFGVETSGHVLLYDAGGNLLFSGGITAARGESGDNAGATAIVHLLRHERADRAETFVFGCPLKGRCQAKPPAANSQPFDTQR
jgi:hypothetical protein